MEENSEIIPVKEGKNLFLQLISYENYPDYQTIISPSIKEFKTNFYTQNLNLALLSCINGIGKEIS